ncbi:MAG: hypothetical protein PHY08_09235 [Candidatus Cloacimonetes bacterium]|nr:hypothetical protein [Candidatus Cloacimonadota bacterium]
MKQAIHITHEAAVKIGGIGAVLAGLCTADIYLKNVDRTIFYGPLFDDSPNSKDRLGKNSEILFSTIDKIKNSIYNDSFDKISRKYDIDIVYGTKTLFDEIHPEKVSKIEILLLGVKNMHQDLISIFKFQLWETYKFSCQEYETDWDFEQYLRIAIPIRMITNYLLTNEKETIYFSHEYMGIASCLSIDLNRLANEKIYFHAHEISTARAITEKIPGHDVSFYHLLKDDIINNISLEHRFGSQRHNSRNELIKLADKFDNILAVGDWVKQEYMYLKPNTNEEKIKICYNAIPIPKYSYEQKLKSRQRLQQYCENLFNFTPDIVFSHVTRLVISKGLWRDISLMEELDIYFSKNNLKGFMIILSTLIGSGKPSEDIHKMENDYGWPVLHKENYPDLIGYENDIYWSCQYFNSKSKSIKVIFINQYGFTPAQIGNRLPENTNFADLRLGSDAELGMSIYEPFGIAQIETVPFGGIAVLSKVCGSAFLLEKTFENESLKPYHIIDFAQNNKDKQNWLNLTNYERTEIEKNVLKSEAVNIFNLLPKNNKERETLFNLCQEYAHRLSWNETIKNWNLFD